MDLSSTDVGPQVVRAYLSPQHFEDVENSCPMVALPTDVARSGKEPKRVFQAVFKAMVSALERSMVENGQPRRTMAQAMGALCVGGMVVAQAMVDRNLADELRNACMAVALALGGWDKNQLLYWVMVVRLNSALLDASQPAVAFFCNESSESE